jgi:Phosphoribosylanthranilate isomerase
MKVKVCGLKYPENIVAVDQCGVDYVGMIFYNMSKRRVTKILPETVSKRVGVFVNESASVIENRIKEHSISVVQLHGEETPDFCREIKNMGVEVIKAISIGDENDIMKCADYEKDNCVIISFDTKCAGYGGSGKSFDWNIIEKYKGEKKFFISGGISNEDVVRIKAIKNNNLYGVDLNSRFEIEPGLKDIALIKEFIKELK